MQRIVFLCVATIATSLLISVIAGPRSWKFFWLIPVRLSPAVVWQTLRSLFQSNPVIAVRIALFTATTLVTVGWLAWRVVQFLVELRPT